MVSMIVLTSKTSMICSYSSTLEDTSFFGFII